METYEDIKQRHARPNGHAGPKQQLLPVLDFADIMSQLNAAAIVKGMFGRAAMSVIYGDSNTGKTFLALDLAAHVALGRPWFGRRVQQGAVLYLAVEGAYGVQNRIAAFRQYYDIAGAVPFAVVPAQIDLRSEKADTDRLIATIEATAERFECPLVLVIVDTLTRALAGGSDSDPADMGAYVLSVDRIRLSTNAHMLSIHHTGKNADRGARGHSSLRAAADTEIEVTRDDARGVSIARVMKQRDLPGDGEPIAFRLERVELGSDEDRDPVSSCVVLPADDVPAPSKRRPLTPATKRALDLLHAAMANNPIPAPASSHIPRSVTSGVSKTVWRHMCEKGGIINSEGSPREQLRRFVVTLKDAGFIGVWEDFVWLVTSRHRSVT
jgi:hypothetical protein